MPVNRVHAANASGHSMNGRSIEAIVPSKVPRVQCHPNVAVAAAVTAKMPNSTRCRREGAHKHQRAERRDLGRGDRAEDRGGDRCLRRRVERAYDHVHQRGHRGRDQEDVGADLDAVALVEMVVELRTRELHERHEEQRERQIGDPRLVGTALVHVGDEEHHVDRPDHEQGVGEVHRAPPRLALARPLAG